MSFNESIFASFNPHLAALEFKMKNVILIFAKNGGANPPRNL